ncbi:hypothetical protein BU23DRAFT_574341 [Bimuria novae-zelandiae CBS 107.79]|uniref:Uncharacterized protein n=1 Tax=Bimuria novae-zelandiae CBS 107.79 TaxID=1447943 RepID=A0A6A5UYD5_9PLEO|nr:hypothetical protein BU23DRAFT_574341 [Bimuria novae-zelandiae CBS 107.79]
MPPPLSDYDWDSSSESDTHAVPASKTKDQSYCPQPQREPALSSPSPEPERPRQSTAVICSKKRKQRGLLHELDLGNIVPSEDNIPASSVPISFYNTRGSTRSTRTLLYDQKYHPMDEYLRPSQAAKRRAEHGIDDEEDTDSVGFHDQADGESETDVEEQPQTKKRKKLDKLATRRSTRRSSRKVNRNVLYNAKVHPQDSQLGQLSDSTVSQVNEDYKVVFTASSVAADEIDEVVAITSSPVDDNSDEVISRASSVAAREVDRRVIRNTNEDYTDFVVSSPSRSTPLSTISVGNPGHRLDLPDDSRMIDRGNNSPLSSVEQTPFEIYKEPLHEQFAKEATARDSNDLSHLEQTPFEIYEEPLEVQLAKESTAAEAIDYDHDDKENAPGEPAMLEDAFANIDIRRMAGDAANERRLMHYLHPGSVSMFDGTDDRIGVASNVSRTAARANDIGYDSILGDNSSLPSSEVDSVLG